MTATASATAAVVPAPPENDVPKGRRKSERLAWSPDGRSLAAWCGAACEDEPLHGKARDEPRPVYVWDFASGGLRGTVESDPTNSRPTVHGVAWSDDGAWLVTSVYDRLRVWRAGDLGKHTETQDNWIYASFAVRPDSKSLVWLNGYGVRALDFRTNATILLWDLRSTAAPRMIQEASSSASGGSLSFSPDGAWLAVAGDGVVRVFRTKGEPSPRDITNRTTNASGTTLEHRLLGWDDGGTLYVLDAGGAVRGWSSKTETIGLRLDVGRGATDAAFSTGHRFLAVANGDVTVWRLSNRARAVLRIIEDEGRLSATVLTSDVPRRVMPADEVKAFFAQ